ncbi:MAG: hypothetical protein H7Z15_18795 [Rhizobacter sp.]|nr:hypothetical protein [Rhizobacter sp.]
MINWKGVFCGRDINPARRSQSREAIYRATQHATWRDALARNSWQPAWLSGKPFEDAIELDTISVKLVSQLLKLRRN